MEKEKQFSLWGIHEFIKTIKTQDEARDYAIEWQNWVGEQNQIGEEPTLFMSDLAEWQAVFEELATRFPDLREEFEENGIL